MICYGRTVRESVGGGRKRPTKPKSGSRTHLQDPARVGGVAVGPVVAVPLLRRQVLGLLHLTLSWLLWFGLWFDLFG